MSLRASATCKLFSTHPEVKIQLEIFFKKLVDRTWGEGNEFRKPLGLERLMSLAKALSWGWEKKKHPGEASQ